ncbi:hypothetical protein C0584_00290 [Candidatus Parcubacteria bacterium]|nr:MAG: hypothetical protein C0584_00290 [Candidatus Parcubacteria bacterium]
MSKKYHSVSLLVAIIFTVAIYLVLINASLYIHPASKFETRVTGMLYHVSELSMVLQVVLILLYLVALYAFIRLLFYYFFDKSRNCLPVLFLWISISFFSLLFVPFLHFDNSQDKTYTIGEKLFLS